MSAPRKYGQDFRDRAVRMHPERMAEPGESKLGARGHVGSLLDVNQATSRNWVEQRYPVDGTGFGSGQGTDSAEVRALMKRAAEPERANEILKTSYNTDGSTQRSATCHRLSSSSRTSRLRK